MVKVTVWSSAFCHGKEGRPKEKYITHSSQNSCSHQEKHSEMPNKWSSMTGQHWYPLAKFGKRRMKYRSKSYWWRGYNSEGTAYPLHQETWQHRDGLVVYVLVIFMYIYLFTASILTQLRRETVWTSLLKGTGNEGKGRRIREIKTK